MYDDIRIEDFMGENTINIFSDASMTKGPGKSFVGCYGVIAMNKHTELERQCKIATNTTVNNSEIKGIRLAIDVAIKYRPRCPIINIFSDSQISVFGLRDRMRTWTVQNQTMYGYGHAKIASQEVYLEIARIVTEASLYFNLFHQKGHVQASNYESIREATHVFRASNGIRGQVDHEFIYWISQMNDKVDKYTRTNLSELYRKLPKQERSQIDNHDAVSFMVSETHQQQLDQLWRNMHNEKE